ncbi:BRD4-interacting chromatin-remodeling complex-associated protein isoform X2 [Corythoichthys intestinalis]|uniref:BRD4-interacting chromatin-remodeling complex-associated protein isoform X2 n=1 Tax=Corythoichthys intestinalis TaxID=161448 RepID=UPI0025A5545A|nr:BRD4-interacting chromatin-remodeling complex-associated protein isoform X2 [Corythoichthys intestinalis]
MDMEDEDGTCLLDVLCDPQALNDFLHGTTELQTEDLLISTSSGAASLFADTPSPGSLLGDGGGSPSTPPPGCVDLSFLEEALLSSPEGADDPGQAEVPQGQSPVEPECQPKEEVEEKEEEEVTCCDILQQSLKEADITEQTVAQTGETVYLPVPPPPPLPFIAKAVAQALPRDTQSAVEPPQPSLLAVGPGCPSLKPAPPPQLMGLLPGNVFPAHSPESSLVQGSSMIIHKAMTARPLITPAPGIVLQRAPLPIQPKLSISIQPRLVQISPKPLGHKPTTGLALVPGTASPNILLSQKTSTPAPEQLPKPVSLQLLNQSGSFMLQPQGLFQGQNQFLLPGQTQVTITRPAAGALLTTAPPGHQGTPFSGQIVDSSQILAVPQRQLNFSPVFTTTGQLALGQAAIFSPTVFQMPAQLAGSYADSGRGQRALLHGPALANQITLINGSGMLPSDLPSISIVNASSVVQRLPFTAQPPQAGVADAKLGLQTASVVLLQERDVPEEKRSFDKSFLREHLGQAIQQQVSVQPVAPSPPVATVLQPTRDPAPAPDAAQAVEDISESLSQNHDFMQQMQQQARVSPVTSDLLVTPVDSLTPLVDNEQESQPFSTASDPHANASPFPSETEDASLLDSSPSLNDSAPFPDATPIPGLEGSSPGPQVQYQFPQQFQSSKDLFVDSGGILASPSQSLSSEHSSVPGISVPQQWPDLSAGGGVDTPVQMNTQNTPTTALAIESDVLTPDIHSPSSINQQWPQGGPAAPKEGVPTPRNQQLAGMEPKPLETLTPATKRHRFQQMLCSDHLAVQNPHTGPAFCSLTEAACRLLPYHACAGHTPSQEDLTLVDQEFDIVSGFLLKRSKDMVNKYRQLLVRETWESPSAEMVMLERLFLQAERFSFGEDRRRAQGDPETFLKSLTSSASASEPRSAAPAWSRMSYRPPGLKTYRSSSRGALRLTIKQECGSRMVVHSSFGDLALKRDRAGRLSNGASRREDKIPDGAEPKKKNLPEASLRDAPKVKCLRLDVPLPLSPPPGSLQEDSVLSEHLQSAIDSILELQRLQGASAEKLTRTHDQSVTSALEGHL